jgi:hypothetical protein
VTFPRGYICHGLAAFIGFCVLTFLVQILDRHPVVLLDASKSYISPSPAKAGDTVWITWSAIERRNCEGIVIPRVIDRAGRVFEYAYSPTVYHDLLSPAARTFSKPFILPVGMAPGLARYEAVVRRWCNWEQKYFWPMVDEPFPIYFDVN